MPVDVLLNLDNCTWADEMSAGDLETLWEAVEELAELLDDQVTGVLEELAAGPHVAVSVVGTAAAEMADGGRGRLRSRVRRMVRQLHCLREEDDAMVDKVRDGEDAPAADLAEERARLVDMVQVRALPLDMAEVRRSRSIMEAMAWDIVNALPDDQCVEWKLRIAEAAGDQAVRTEQNSCELLLETADMSRLLDEMLRLISPSMRLSANARRALCEAAQAMAVSLLHDGNLIAASGQREQVHPSHVQLAHQLTSPLVGQRRRREDDDDEGTRPMTFPRRRRAMPPTVSPPSPPSHPQKDEGTCEDEDGVAYSAD